MSLHDFIFSNKRWHRTTRHLIFWLAWFLFSAVGQISFTANDRKPLADLTDIIYFQIMRSVGRLPSILLFCYFTAYFLVPRFTRKGKFKQLVLIFLISALLLYITTFGWFVLTINVVRINQLLPPWPMYSLFFNSFYSNVNFTGAIPACCVMLAIKYYKDWYVRQHLTEQLSRENVHAELQMLKAQIHPHFLFNTLNNIYSFILTDDSRAAGLVDKLSGMVDYMRIEGENSLVSLEKEIKLIKDYVGLEKVRYGDRLDLKVEINGQYQNKLIAPLLMIPFVENCFKHGASIMRGKQWISLLINLENDLLDFRLSNSKPPDLPPRQNKKTIGLTNVKKRLHLLYPERHLLEINSTDNVYEIHLLLALQEEIVPVDLQQALLLKKPAYA